MKQEKWLILASCFGTSKEPSSFSNHQQISPLILREF